MSECQCYRCIRDRGDELGLTGIPLYAVKMVLCETCGNKRCPHATDHRLECTRSNEPGQHGSRYPKVEVDQ